MVTMGYTQADEIAYVEDLQWQMEFHQERQRKDAREIGLRLNEYLRNFDVLINLRDIRKLLREHESNREKCYFYNQTGNLKGQDNVNAGLLCDVFGLNVELRSNPDFLEVERQLFIHQHYIKLKEQTLLRLSIGVEATLTSESHTLTIPYQESTGLSVYRLEKGFFVPDKELTSDFYHFRFEPLSVKKIDLIIER